ncbi:MAG: hypothetical protein ACRDBQ_20170, partial [Shewanella sp.]
PMVGGELPATAEGDKPKTDGAAVNKTMPAPQTESEAKTEQNKVGSKEKIEQPATDIRKPNAEPVNSKVALPIKQIQGESHAHQLVAMPEQPRRQREPVVYRIAA